MIGYSEKDNLCQTCEFYNWGDHECRKGQVIREILIVVECEDYEEEPNNVERSC